MHSTRTGSVGRVYLYAVLPPLVPGVGHVRHGELVSSSVLDFLLIHPLGPGILYQDVAKHHCRTSSWVPMPQPMPPPLPLAKSGVYSRHCRLVAFPVQDPVFVPLELAAVRVFNRRTVTIPVQNPLHPVLLVSVGEHDCWTPSCAMPNTVAIPVLVSVLGDNSRQVVVAVDVAVHVVRHGAFGITDNSLRHFSGEKAVGGGGKPGRPMQHAPTLTGVDGHTPSPPSSHNIQVTVTSVWAGRREHETPHTTRTSKMDQVDKAELFYVDEEPWVLTRYTPRRCGLSHVHNAMCAIMLKGTHDGFKYTPLSQVVYMSIITLPREFRSDIEVHTVSHGTPNMFPLCKSLPAPSPCSSVVAEVKCDDH